MRTRWITQQSRKGIGRNVHHCNADGNDEDRSKRQWVGGGIVRRDKKHAAATANGERCYHADFITETRNVISDWNGEDEIHEVKRLLYKSGLKVGEAEQIF